MKLEKIGLLCVCGSPALMYYLPIFNRLADMRYILSA
jgi:hypothetical protein